MINTPLNLDPKYLSEHPVPNCIDPQLPCVSPFVHTILVQPFLEAARLRP